MNTNKIIIISSIIIILLILGIPTTYKIVKKHNEKLIEVTYKKIIDAADKCYNEKKCSGDEISLNTLYELKYLEEVSNPITREVYNKDSIIKLKDKEYIFIPKE